MFMWREKVKEKVERWEKEKKKRGKKKMKELKIDVVQVNAAEENEKRRGQICVFTV